MFEILKDIVHKNKYHLSKNKFKSNEEYDTYMVTIRDRNVTADYFSQKVDDFNEKLKKCGFIIDKTIKEYCFYDDNLKKDNSWIG